MKFQRPQQPPPRPQQRKIPAKTATRNAILLRRLLSYTAPNQLLICITQVLIMKQKVRLALLLKFRMMTFSDSTTKTSGTAFPDPNLLVKRILKKTLDRRKSFQTITSLKSQFFRGQFFLLTTSKRKESAPEFSFPTATFSLPDFARERSLQDLQPLMLQLEGSSILKMMTGKNGM